MSLKLLSNRDMFAYLQLGNLQDPVLADGVEFDNVSAFRPARMYLDRFGTFSSIWDEGGVDWRVIRFDPEMIDSTGSHIGTWITTSIQPQLIGDYEPITGTQKIFSHDNAIFDEKSYTDPTDVLDADPFPAIDFDGPRTGAGGPTAGQEGFWSLALSNNTPNAVFFPDWGFLLLSRATCVHSDLVSYSTVMVLVDLSTGFGTIVQEIPASYESSPSQFQAGPLYGEGDMSVDYIQFIPDADSRHIAPKGRLLQCLRSQQPSASTDLRYYVLFYDWNPTGSPGSPDRVHGRLGFSSRCIAQELATSTTVLPATPENFRVGETVVVNYETPLFDSSRNRLVLWSSVTDANGNARAGCHSILEWSLGAELAQLRPPGWLDIPSTGRVNILDTDARGDLGEVIGGKVINWTLERTSSRAEVIDVSLASPGDLIAVANGPITIDSDYPREVRKNGTPLVEGAGNDYTWDSTGVQFLAPEPVSSEAYEVDYPHPATPVTPSHGTLLSATSITDDEGLGQARVRYADDDDLALQRDKLTAEAEE